MTECAKCVTQSSLLFWVDLCRSHLYLLVAALICCKVTLQALLVSQRISADLESKVLQNVENFKKINKKGVGLGEEWGKKA